MGKYWFERFARLRVEINVASEFRYRNPPLPDNGLMLVVSQSGETADTLASLRFARGAWPKGDRRGQCADLHLAREADVAAPTLAGPEIGVASTKAFTCQLTVLAALAIALGRARGVLGAARRSG